MTAACGRMRAFATARIARRAGPRSKQYKRACVATLAMLAPLVAGAQKTIEGTALAVSGDTLRIGGVTVALSGIAAPAPGVLCEGKITQWHCGDLARAALAAVLDGGAVRCLIDAAAPGAAGRCTLGERDVAQLQVAAGWARATPSGDYGIVEAGARQQRRGLWRNE